MPFRSIQQNLTACVVSTDSTANAFIAGLEQAIKDDGRVVENLMVTYKVLRINERDPYAILDTSSRKYFQKAHYHRRILILPLDTPSLRTEELHLYAETKDIELFFLEPCIERHLLNAHDIVSNADIDQAEYQKLLSDRFGSDYHPTKPDWHTDKIKDLGIGTATQRDAFTASVHEMLTSSNHKNYG